MNSKIYLDNIRKASQHGKLTFFVGAGVSKLSKYPDWKELTNKFSIELGLDIKGEGENYTTEEYLSIPQKYYYSINQDENKYYNFIDEHLNREDIEHNVIHDLMLHLKPSNIVTTNFDDLIEKSVYKQGLFYDVIACDEDISASNGNRIILKVHGDIKKRNIVLKEEDYLDYNEKFKLVETLLKSIFATTTVVFIGYSLSDYNIKLILNWVRKLQGEGFEEPYFVYTDNYKLDTLDKIYHESRGLRIIDYKDVSETESEYLPRYKSIFNEIISIDKNNTIFDGKNSLDYLYELFKPLNKMNKLRVEDIREKLKTNYYVSDEGVIQRKNNEGNHFEAFNKIYVNLYTGDENNEFDNKKFKLIKEVLSKSSIKSYSDEFGTVDYKFELGIINESNVMIDYKVIFENQEKESNNLIETFSKAYYLFKSGNFEKAFELYTDIAEYSFKTKDYFLYYFAQVNRHSVYTALNSYGYNERKNNYDFSEGTKLEMLRVGTEEVFDNLPFVFKSEYSSLRNLYNSNYLISFTNELMRKIEKLRMSIKKNTMEFGFSSMENVEIYLISNLLFLYDNYLIVEDHVGFRLIINEFVKALLEKYAHSKTVRIDDGKIHNRSFLVKPLSFIYFSCMVQHIKERDLRDYISLNNIKHLEFDDMDKCFKIIMNVFEFYIESEGKMNNSYIKGKFEKYILNSITLLSYMEIIPKQYEYVVNQIFKIKNRNFNVGDKMFFIAMQQKNNILIQGKVYLVLEQILIEYLEYEIKKINEGKKRNELNKNSISMIDIVHYISQNKEGYVSKEISRIVNREIDNSPYIDLILLLKTSKVLEKNTKKRLMEYTRKSIKRQFNYDVLEYIVEYALINDIDSYEDDIYEYISTNINEYEEIKLRMKKVIKLKENRDINFEYLDIQLKLKDKESVVGNVLVNIGYWCFMGIVPKKRFKTFLGLNDKFDFFIDLENFDFDKFKIEWLIEFNVIEAHKNISKVERAKLYIKALIEEYLLEDTFDERQKKWFIKLYIEIYSK